MTHFLAVCFINLLLLLLFGIFGDPRTGIFKKERSGKLGTGLFESLESNQGLTCLLATSALPILFVCVVR